MFFISPNDPYDKFPSVNFASPDGIVAFGGDLKSNRLIAAYQKGIFPWFSEGEPIIWYAPNPRCVLFPDKLKIKKSLRPVINKKQFEITVNQSFEKVIANCKDIDRGAQLGTWITDEMEHAYIELHHKKIAHSVEVWENGILVGGLYGLVIGNVFCGESMFSKVSNASRVGFIFFIKYLTKIGFKLIDCQIENPYLNSLGAELIDRNDYMQMLKFGMNKEFPIEISNEKFKEFCKNN